MRAPFIPNGRVRAPGALAASRSFANVVVTMNLLPWILAACALLAPKADTTVIARAIDEAVRGEAPLFQGDEDRLKTAALVVAVAARESNLKLDAVGDHGRSVCAMQIHGGDKKLLEDHVGCIREGIRRLRISVSTCKDYPVAVYAEGPSGCTSSRAQAISRDRMALARRLVADVKPR